MLEHRLLQHRAARAAIHYSVAAIAFYVVLQILWPAPGGVLFQGVITGSLSVLLAFGLALIYRANRIVNFAQANLGLVPATTALTLIHRGWNYLVAVIVGLVVGVVVGALVQRVFVRRFVAAPRLILTVVTIGVAQILAAASTILIVVLAGGDDNIGAPTPVSFTFHISPITFTGSDAMAVVIVPAVIGALLAFLRYSSMGTAIRACADSSERAALLGVNVARVQTVVWVTAALLSSVGVFLRASSVGGGSVSGDGLALLTRALAAAVIGRMENFGVILAASIGLGIIEQSILWDNGSSLDAVPVTFLVMLGALLFQRRGSRSRVGDGEVSTWKSISIPRPIPWELARLPVVVGAKRVLAGASVLFLVVLPFILDQGKASLAALVLVYAVLGLSLVMLTGWAGQVSLGQAAFFGLGAAVSAALSLNRGWDVALVLLAGGLAGAVAAVVVGLPAIRVQGLYLAVTTLAFAVLTSSWLLNSSVFSWVPDSAAFLPRRALFGRFEIATERSYYFLCLAVLGLALAMTRGLKNSRMGRVLVALRDNERAAQSYGVNAIRARLTVFAISGFLAATAGGLYVHSQQALGRGPFEPAESLKVFTMVVIGGTGSISGALLGSLYLNGTSWFVDLIPNLAVQAAVSFLGTGVGVVVVLLVLPAGLGSLLYRVRDRLLRLVAERGGIVVPSLVADTAGTAPMPPRARWRARRGTPEPPAVTIVETPTAGNDVPALLRVADLEMGYDGVQVLFGVDIELGEAEIVALLGTNGAGKSTVLRGISRLTDPMAGVVTFDGDDLAGLRPDQIASRGLGQVPGGRGVFPALSVGDNLRMATWMMRRDRAACTAATAEAIQMFPFLEEKWNLPAGDLSGGQQQMLTLAQTFMTHPKVVMIDELSLGLAPVIVEELIAVVKAMRDRGVSMILVEQSVNVALTVADRAYFMEKGEVRFAGPTAELLERPDILRSVFIEGAVAAADGRATDPASPERRTVIRSDEVVLAVRDVSCSFGGVRALDDVSLDLHQGEILGILGPNGAGKTTLFDAISGFTRPEEGSIALHGVDVSAIGPDLRAMAGLGRSFQDARLFPSLTVASTIALSLERRLPFRDPLAAALNLKDVAKLEALVSEEVEGLIALLGLHAFRDKFIGELSTGSRRMVDLACTIAHRPSVLLLDEPSSGIAQRETEALGPLIRRIQRETNGSILVIEHDMPLLTSVSDRLIAMETGRIIADGDPRDVLEDPRIIELYLGYSDDVITRSGARAAPRRRKRPVVASREV